MTAARVTERARQARPRPPRPRAPPATHTYTYTRRLINKLQILDIRRDEMSFNRCRRVALMKFFDVVKKVVMKLFLKVKLWQLRSLCTGEATKHKSLKGERTMR